MSVSTRQSAPDTAQGTTDPGVLRARQLNKEAQQRFRQRQAALVQDQESRLVAGQEEIATLKQENRVLRRSIDLQLRVLGCRDAMLAAFRDGAHLNPARQRPAGREMSTEPQALPGQQPSSPQPRDEEGAGRACLGASPKYQAHDASPGSGSGHPVLQAPCGGVAARAEAASGVEGEHCGESWVAWQDLHGDPARAPDPLTLDPEGRWRGWSPPPTPPQRSGRSCWRAASTPRTTCATSSIDGRRGTLSWCGTIWRGATRRAGSGWKVTWPT
uniref:BZIP domain-containing protein n=1 Tax=Auxenochlorella protothecoides TaxID=3075 RepID=A0A1D2ABN4_AUXPR